MKISKLDRKAFEQAYKRAAAGRGTPGGNKKYAEVYRGLYALGLGESLKVDFDTNKEAKNCYSTVHQTLRRHGLKNGVTYKSFVEGSTLYLYPKARVV